MRTLGLIGGMSWESTAEYYRLINEGVRSRLGPLRSARILLHSVDFGPIEQAMRASRWTEVAEALADAARSLEAGGAECLVLCTNTMHRVAGQVRAASSLPFLHIADGVCARARRDGLLRVGLLGTRFTMSQPFLVQYLGDRGGLQVLVPDARVQEQVHGIIFDELCAGILRKESRAVFHRAMASLVERGAQAIVLACTEISLLVTQDDADVPLLDTTALHAQAAIDFALATA